MPRTTARSYRPRTRSPSQCLAQGRFTIAAGPDIGAAVHDHAIEPVSVVRQRRRRAVSPVGQGTITTMAPADMIQWATDCSMYCKVFPVNRERDGSACEKQAESPILRRREAGISGL